MIVKPMVLDRDVLYHGNMRKIIGIFVILAVLAGVFVYFGPNFATVKLERLEGGEIKNPIYSVTIRGDGSVVYEGKLAKDIGKKTDVLKPNQARSLVMEFLKLNPFKLDSKYKSEINNGAQPNRLTFSFLFYSKQVEFDEISAPDYIVNLAEKMDNITNSKQWVFPEEF